MGDKYEKRISAIEYKNDKLTILRRTWKNKKSNDETNMWTKEELGKNIMDIVSYSMGLTKTAADMIAKLIESINPHPTLEEAFVDFEKNGSSYKLTINADNLLGIKLGNNGVIGNVTLNIKESEAYPVFDNTEDNEYHKFIESVGIDEMNLANIIKVNFSLDSVNSKTSGVEIIQDENGLQYYKTQNGKQIQINDSFRKSYLQELKEYLLQTQKEVIN